MRRRGLVLAAVGAATVVGAVPALAVVGSVPESRTMGRPWSGEVVPATPPDLPDDARAVAALERAAEAARDTSYRGTAAVQEWGAEGGVGRVIEVARVAGRDTVVRVRGSMDDPVVTPDGDGAPSAAPGDSGRVLGLLARNFAVDRAGPDRVAGRTAVVVEARRADGGLAARLWLDRERGLVLRREVYDASGRTVQSAAFLSLRLAPSPTGRREGTSRPPAGAAAAGPVAAPAAPAPTPWTLPLDPADLGSWRARGWICPEALPEGLTLVDLRRGSDDGIDVLQMVYSDGLTTVSLFEQHGRLGAEAPAGFRPADVAGIRAWTRPGAPAQVVWQAEDSVITLVADAPSDLVAAVVAAVSGPASTPDGILDRVARGWHRVVDALTP